MTRFVIVAFLSLLLNLTPSVMAAITSVSPSGVGANNPLEGDVGPTPVVHLSVSPSVVSTCQNMSITWTIDNDTSSIDIARMTLLYSNIGVPQSGNGVTFNPSEQIAPIAVIPLSRLETTWFVFIAEPGYYVINGSAPLANPVPLVVQSEPFLLQPSDTSCLPPDISSSSTIPFPTAESSPSSSSEPAPAPVHKSNTGAIVGGTVAAVVVVAFIAAFWLLNRRRKKLTTNALNVGQRSLPGKGHQRNWGGLSSIDKLQQGEIPVVMPSNSPYASPAYGRNRSQSTGHAMTDEDGMEKSYGKDAFPVDADLLFEMPTLDSNRGSRRYSSDALSTAFRQSSGLTAFSDNHGRHDASFAAPPVLSTTTATSRGGDDPFSDAAFINRGKRASALSVPSTARAPSRVSDISVSRPTPSPLPTPTTSNPPSQANTMIRNTSATASVGRPARKPVPQYTDDSIELTNTSKSSPTSHSPLSPQLSRNNSGSRSHTEVSSSSASRNHSASPIDPSAYWLHDRAPVANRNIGLAGQSDGPVHYLMPDLPPPSAE